MRRWISPCRTRSFRRWTPRGGGFSKRLDGRGTERSRHLLFSPAGRRWPEGSDEGAARHNPSVRTRSALSMAEARPARWKPVWAL
ncbi:hypothetical protein CO666_27185 [Rhizobium chutanense]|uniref:Uncharacterized protein n=1 Tax=Rhizobium chutanense TaxID=2035448 RepID=A0A2A6J5Q5_9HYPH|nr:hypothetical protein CO666_27185 [Rhizobium chutanense]